MTDEDTPSINRTLGELSGKLDGLRQSVDTSALSQATFNAEMRAEIKSVREAAVEGDASIREDLGAVKEDVGILKATRPIKHPWWAVWSAVAAVISAGATIIFNFAIHH